MKKALILGRGISGEGAKAALKSLGYSTQLYDDGDGLPPPTLSDKSVVIVSPGVSIRHPLVVEAKGLGIDTYGEIELGYRLSKCPLIAITGTNGKTTVTKLIDSIMHTKGLKSRAVGNCGVSLARVATDGEDYDVLVCEVSSFQIESTISFRPDIAMITNLSPDHLDRHGTMEDYALTKLRIAENQTDKNFLLLSADSIPVRYMRDFAPRSHVLFCSTKGVTAGSYMRDQKLYYFDEYICDRANLRLVGEHNVSNALFAIATARIMGIDKAIIAKALSEFVPDEHRLVDLGLVGGKRYFDDSKGTNIDACLKACQSMVGDTALILGGSSKGYDFGELLAGLPPSIVYITAIGQTADEIKLAGIKHNRAVTISATLNEAVERCHKADTVNVLLSPACASFDMFRDYSDRGNQFRQIVKKLQS